MRLESRSFSGQLFRPKPEIRTDDATGLAIVATPWGARESARRTTELISELFVTLERDMEATTPYQRLPTLSPTANNLRIGVLMANEYVFGTYNKDEFRTGVELFASVKRGNELFWINVGMPQTILLRKGKPPFPLAMEMDLAFDMSHDKLMAPLPSRLLGLDKIYDVNVTSLRIEPNDRFVLLSRSYFPTELLTKKQDKLNIDEIAKICSKDQPTSPAWIGILEI